MQVCGGVDISLILVQSFQMTKLIIYINEVWGWC